MRWVQWAILKVRATQIHITADGRVTLCGKRLPSQLLLHSEVPPTNDNPVCRHCQKAEEEARPYL